MAAFVNIRTVHKARRPLIPISFPFRTDYGGRIKFHNGR